MHLAKLTSPADLRALSPAQLDELCAEIRHFIVQAVSRTGGHLGSNLGTVELTVALHRVFESPRDVIVWDTGHQTYVHKLITGRREGFERLRQRHGLSGYPSMSESPHDVVENSHASTSLSWASGLAAGFALTGHEHRRVVAVIGDGSMTGGIAFEALNNLGHYAQRALIVLNDNGRSYAPTVSRLSAAVSRLRQSPHYVQGRRVVDHLLERVPLGDGVRRSLDSAAAAMREMWEPPAFFETLGVRYLGPVDGHDIGAMESAFRDAAAYAEGPVVVHVVTQKGRGYAPAEHDTEKHLHDIGLFDPATGSSPALAPAELTPEESREAPSESATSSEPTVRDEPARQAEPTVRDEPARQAEPTVRDEPARQAEPTVRDYTAVFTETLIAAARRNRDLVAITAAMGGSTGLLPFQREFPERFYDVGIAEQHALTSAAGMARAGLRPVVAVYSTFMARAFDQALYDIGLHRLPVILCVDRAGITGPDGASHHGLYDIAMFTRVPDMTVFAPSSPDDLPVAFAHALEITDGPVAIRWPRGKGALAGPIEPLQTSPGGMRLQARRRRTGPDACVLAAGQTLSAAAEAADLLSADGTEVSLWDPRVIKPLDRAMLLDAASHPLVVTVEDGVRVGGFGSLVSDALQQLDAPSVPRVCQLGTPDAYLPHGSAAELAAEVGLDAKGIAASVGKILARMNS
ncbi:1-deoxy-D-xylulose-5-phosphate synthase [Candidatus Poriferisodalis sp.]|uniref:1-deoxy-D-xylulose-5-phosphate synthase n=1 Tax=Candidatus Poriferisodalis sp. TaxID=3101277 RepID=UPI003B02482F